MTRLDEEFNPINIGNVKEEPKSALFQPPSKLGENKNEVNPDDLRTASRNDTRIRNGLLSRLTYEKIWLQPKAKPKQAQTCIIFDWDDTLLCRQT